MSSFVPNKHHLREVLLYFFNMKKRAAEAHRLLAEVYPGYVPSVATCERWFVRFRKGDLDIEDKVRSGPAKKFEDVRLEAMLNEGSCHTQEELARLLRVDRSTIAKRLKTLGMRKRGVDSLNDDNGNKTTKRRSIKDDSTEGKPADSVITKCGQTSTSRYTIGDKGIHRSLGSDGESEKSTKSTQQFNTKYSIKNSTNIVNGVRKGAQKRIKNRI